jgi:1-deoxy-D-xylulose-5-phosphate synthase
MWDLSIMQIVPGIRIGAPRDAVRLRSMLRQAVAQTDGPNVLRFPKGAVVAEVPAVGTAAGLEVLAEYGEVPDVLIVAVGAMAGIAVEAAARLGDQGIGARVVDPGWIAPVPEGLVALAADSDVVAVVEDSGRVGGFGSRLAGHLADHGLDRPVRTFGIEQRFLEHASRARLLQQMGLTPAAIAATLVGLVAQRTDGLPATGLQHQSP